MNIQRSAPFTKARNDNGDRATLFHPAYPTRPIHMEAKNTPGPTIPISPFAPGDNKTQIRIPTTPTTPQNKRSHHPLPSNPHLTLFSGFSFRFLPFSIFALQPHRTNFRGLKPSLRCSCMAMISGRDMGTGKAAVPFRRISQSGTGFPARTEAAA